MPFGFCARLRTSSFHVRVRAVVQSGCSHEIGVAQRFVPAVSRSSEAPLGLRRTPGQPPCQSESSHTRTLTEGAGLPLERYAHKQAAYNPVEPPPTNPTPLPPYRSSTAEAAKLSRGAIVARRQTGHAVSRWKDAGTIPSAPGEGCPRIPPLQVSWEPSCRGHQLAEIDFSLSCPYHTQALRDARRGAQRQHQPTGE